MLPATCDDVVNIWPKPIFLDSAYPSGLESLRRYPLALGLGKCEMSYAGFRVWLGYLKNKISSISRFKKSPECKKMGLG